MRGSGSSPCRPRRRPRTAGSTVPMTDAIGDTLAQRTSCRSAGCVDFPSAPGGGNADVHMWVHPVCRQSGFSKRYPDHCQWRDSRCVGLSSCEADGRYEVSGHRKQSVGPGIRPRNCVNPNRECDIGIWPGQGNGKTVSLPECAALFQRPCLDRQLCATGRQSGAAAPGSGRRRSCQTATRTTAEIARFLNGDRMSRLPALPVRTGGGDVTAACSPSGFRFTKYRGAATPITGDRSNDATFHAKI